MYVLYDRNGTPSDLRIQKRRYKRKTYLSIVIEWRQPIVRGDLPVGGGTHHVYASNHYTKKEALRKLAKYQEWTYAYPPEKKVRRWRPDRRGKLQIGSTANQDCLRAAIRDRLNKESAAPS